MHTKIKKTEYFEAKELKQTRNFFKNIYVAVVQICSKTPNYKCAVHYQSKKTKETLV